MKKLLAILPVSLLVLSACGASVEVDTSLTPVEDTPVVIEGTSTPATEGTSTQTLTVPASDDTTKIEVKIDTTTKKEEIKQAVVVKPELLVVNMTSDNLFFKPSTVAAKVGQEVTINFANNGFHTFEIPALGINVDLKNKSAGNVTFTPTKAGTFPFECGVPGHKDGGMHGSLTVTE